MADDSKSKLPLIQIFIRSSTIDRERKGSCPICQQWFMAACILTEQEILSFQVTIVDAESPPQRFRDLTGGRRFPVVLGISGRNAKDQDIKDQVANSIDEVEQFFDDFQCTDLMRSGDVLLALDAIKDLYQAFNLYISSNTSSDRLTTKLQKLDDFLGEMEKRYLVKDHLTYADCYLMPKLHHIKVTAKEYKNYDIPDTLLNVWRYIYEMYQTPAFVATCCCDQDIIKHYQAKAHCQARHGAPSLQKTTESFDVPAHILQFIEGRGSQPVAESGDAHSESVSESSSVQDDGQQATVNHDASFD